MKSLVVEDDFSSRKIMQVILSEYGECDVTVNGLEAVEAVKHSLCAKTPYDVIFLDIMMPEMDGQSALKEIRALEKAEGIRGRDEVKIVMLSALDDPKSVFEAYNKGGATGYMAKPIDKQLILHKLRDLDLI